MGIVDFQYCNYCQLLSDFSSKFQSSMTTYHYIDVKDTNITNFISMIGMDSIKFESSMIVVVNLYIRSVLREVTMIT